MNKLDDAISRLAQAVSDLELAVSERPAELGDTAIVTMQSERDLLASEVERLRARAEKDAELRTEAADAVRQALLDLRGAVGGETHGHA